MRTPAQIQRFLDENSHRSDTCSRGHAGPWKWRERNGRVERECRSCRAMSAQNSRAQRLQCAGCGLYFRDLRSFDGHQRAGRCLTEAELRERGYRKANAGRARVKVWRYQWCRVCGKQALPVGAVPGAPPACSREHARRLQSHHRRARRLETKLPDRVCAHCSRRLPRRMRSNAVYCSRKCKGRASSRRARV
jgi:hypothetical protein